jgi:hypothetical protein
MNEGSLSRPPPDVSRAVAPLEVVDPREARFEVTAPRLGNIKVLEQLTDRRALA